MARNFALVVCFTAASAYVGFEITSPAEPPRVRFATEAPAYLLKAPLPVKDTATKLEPGDRSVDDSRTVQLAAR